VGGRRGAAEMEELQAVVVTFLDKAGTRTEREERAKVERMEGEVYQHGLLLACRPCSG